MHHFGTGEVKRKRKAQVRGRWRKPEDGTVLTEENMPLWNKTEVLPSEMQLQWIWRKNQYQTVTFFSPDIIFSKMAIQD